MPTQIDMFPPLVLIGAATLLALAITALIEFGNSLTRGQR